jgi:UDPglucose--hexose-1-phosphate uridylyltransferase
MPPEDYGALAACLKETLTRLNVALTNPPYNFVVHTAPCKDPYLEHFHWHIEIMPKLTKVAGFEWGTGFYINPTPPEEAAQYLREVTASEVV